MWQKMWIRARAVYAITIESLAPVIDLLYWPLLLAGLSFCVFWQFRLPTAGVAIGALGAAGVLVAIKGEKLGEGHRVVWAFITLIFLVTEIRAIKKDHKDQDDKQEKTITAIVSGYQGEMKQNQQQFDATMARLDTHTSKLADLIETDEQIEVFAKKGLENITGGDSFAYVSPQPSDGPAVPLVVWNHGRQPLTGVTIAIARTQDPNWGNEFFNPIFIGTIGPGNYQPIPTAIVPKPDETSGIDHYWIMISAQNGTVSQTIDFRKNRRTDPPNQPPWAWRFNVTKSEIIKKPMGKIPKGATLMKPIYERGWSDEAQ